MHAGCRWYWFKFIHFRSDAAAFIPINYRVMNMRLIAGWKSCNQSYWCECFDREKWNEKVWWSKSISKKLFRKKFHWRGCWRLISLETVPTSFHAALRRCRWSALALTTGNRMWTGVGFCLLRRWKLITIHLLFPFKHLMGRIGVERKKEKIPSERTISGMAINSP